MIFNLYLKLFKKILTDKKVDYNKSILKISLWNGNFTNSR